MQISSTSLEHANEAPGSQRSTSLTAKVTPPGRSQTPPTPFFFSAASGAPPSRRAARRLSHSIGRRLKMIDLGGKSLRSSCMDGGEAPAHQSVSDAVRSCMLTRRPRSRELLSDSSIPRVRK